MGTERKVDFPYTPKTKVPEIQYEDFNGARFGYQLWSAVPDKEDPKNTKVKGRVLLVHGFGEYHLIALRFMDFLSQNGYESFIFDQRGAGVTSPGKLKGITNEYHTFNDLEHFVEKNLAECKENNTPLFLWGHSMGGGIVLNYGCKGKHKGEIDGYVVSGPLIILHPRSQPNVIARTLGSMAAHVMPNFRVDSGLQTAGITSDERYRSFLENDPMSIPLIGSLRQISDFLERGEKLYKNKNNYVQNNFVKNKPVLIMHGKDDTINDPKGSEKFFQICPAADKELKLYPGMRHSIFTLETDENVARVHSDVKEWLDSHSFVLQSRDEE